MSLFSNRRMAAVLLALLLLAAPAASAAEPGSEAYIRQSRGQVAPGSTIMTKPPPEVAGGAPAAPPVATAPETCNAQNASLSQACYTATQQARPPSK